MTNEMQTPAIDENLTFMQNIVAFADTKGKGTKAKMAEHLGVGMATFSPSKLRVSPHSGTMNMTPAQADSIIDIVLPDDINEQEEKRLKEQFRQLSGFPERSIEEAMKEILGKNADNKDLEVLSEQKFGEIFRFHREQRKYSDNHLNEGKRKGGEPRYLTIAELCDGIMPTAGFSEMERGESVRVTESKGLQIIFRLGYKPNEAGLEKFLLDSAEMLKNHELRAEKFQRALFAFMYPDGKTRYGGKDPNRITQADLVKATSTDNQYINGLLRGVRVPKESDAADILRVFDINSEQEFYDKADAIYRENPNLTPPKPSLPHANTKKFGELVRTLREEICITQTALQTKAFNDAEQPKSEKGEKFTLRIESGGKTLEVPADMTEEIMEAMGCDNNRSFVDRLSGKSPNDNSVISRLELGKRIMPLEDEEVAKIIKAFGCESEEQFADIAGKAKILQEYREKHFVETLQKLSNSGNAAAKVMLQVHDKTAICNPDAVKESLKALKMSEREIYQETQENLPEDVLKACDAVSDFIAKFDYKKYTSVGRNFYLSGETWKR